MNATSSKKSCLSHAFWSFPILNARAIKTTISKSVKSEPFVSAFSFPPSPGDSRFLLCLLSIGIWSYSFERVPFLGRMSLLLSPRLRCWDALRLFSGCFWVLPLVSYPPAWFYACLPFVSHLPLTVSEYSVGAPTAWFYTFVACDGCDIGIDMARESKPRKNEIKNEMQTRSGPWQEQAPSWKVQAEGWSTWRI